MRRRFALLSGLLLLAALSLAGAGPAAGMSAEQQVLARVEELAAAFLEADAGRLSEMIGPQYVHTNTGGGVVDRDRWLAYVRSRREELESGALVVTRYENRDVKVALHGDVAIVTGLNVSEGVRNRTPFSTELRFTMVWLRTNEGWKRVAFHDTSIDR